jgi:hypothetical protein
MSTSYYYFAASLPNLQFGMKPPMSCEDFLEDCQRLLSEQDFSDVFKAIKTDPRTEVSNELLQECKGFEHNFCNEIAWLRASRSHKNPLEHIRGERTLEPSIINMLTQASKIENLFEIEMFIDKIKWDMLDELVQGHHFDLEFIIVYGLKLKILERYQEIQSPKGNETLELFEEEVLEVK